MRRLLRLQSRPFHIIRIAPTHGTIEHIEGKEEHASEENHLIGPSLAHLDGLFPSCEPLRGVLCRDAGLEDRTVLRVDILELLKRLPDASSEARRDSSAEGGRLPHAGPVHRNANDIGLGLMRIVSQ